jgi:hypothetical protein
MEAKVRSRMSYILMILFVCGTGNVHAIAVADLPTSEDPPANEGYTLNWDYVYNYKGSSASAVDHYWILTAAHVADDGGSGNLTIGGIVYTQQVVVLHSQAADPDNNQTADIALVRYDKPLPGYYLLNDTVPVSQDILICGFGREGTVVRTSATAYFTESGTAHVTKRWGTNKIDVEKTLTYTSPISATSKGFDITISTTKGNAGGTAYEAGCNIYDSGGGMFYNDGGTWKLAGHMVARYGTATSGQFAGNFAVATKYYVNWIKSVIVDYDTDMDGLPDWWETEYGVTEAGADPDGDHFTNYEEWIADTIPNDGNSYLRVTAYTTAGEITFNSSLNRKYQIEFRTNLADTNETWQTEVAWFEPVSTQTVQSVSNPPGNRVYRVRAKLR